MTLTGRGAGADDHRLRHGRLARPDRRRVHLRERPALRRRRRRATSSSGARRPRAWSSPTTGASRPSTSRRPRPRSSLAHDIPVAFAVHAVPTQMSSYEVVERGAAAGIVITASHNPWVDNGFKVKAPTGAAAGAEILGVIEAPARGATAGSAIDRRPFADAEAAGLVERFDPFEGYERFVRRTVDLDALRAADMHVLVDPMWGAGSGWIVAPAGRRPDPGQRDPPGAQPVLRRRQPGADPPEHRRGARPILAGGGYDLGLLLDGDADRARGGRRARHVHPPAPGDRPADVLPGRASRLCATRSSSASTTPRWRPGSASTTGSRSTRRRSASSSSARR